MSAGRWVRHRLTATGWWLFGDRLGLLLWLGLLCWFGLTWRLGFFVQDTYATANTLVALAEGQLHVTELRYSLTFQSQPGLHQYDGRLYGRNYGQLVLAVPLVWLLEGVAVVVDPRILLAGLWAGVGLTFVAQLSRLDRFDCRRTRTVGAASVTVLFLLTVSVSTDLSRDLLALAAYQLSTMLAAATAGLLLYRLIRLVHDYRLGLIAGVTLGVATPVGFWATIPKRHTLVATLVLAAVYAFAVSRHVDGKDGHRARVVAYAFAGLVTWTHAFEALFVVTGLAVVDLLTARSNGVRELAVVGLALLVATTPMLATNYAISGNPAEPPRLLPHAGGDIEFSPASDDVAGPTGPSHDRQGASSSESGRRLLGPVAPFVRIVSTFAGQAVVDGVSSLADPAKMWHVFVRSGHIDSVRYEFNDYETIELSLLEATPLFGALLSIPALVTRRLLTAGRPSRSWLSPRRWSPTRQTDLLVVSLAVTLTVVYLPQLPLFSTLTVRYLHPVVPLATYGVFRIPAVRDGICVTPTWFARWIGVVFAATLAVMLGSISTFGFALGEAVQYYALWSLVTATVCGVTVLGRTLRPGRVSSRAVATALAGTVGVAAVYLVLSGLVYFRYGTYAFDVVRLLAEAVPSL